MIEVSKNSETEFEVRVLVGNGESRHLVTVKPETLESVAGGRSAEELIRASFEFLLEREPKEAIMSRFDLTVISRYFPEYEAEIGGYLRE